MSELDLWVMFRAILAGGILGALVIGLWRRPDGTDPHERHRYLANR